MDASIERNAVKPSAGGPGFFERINGEWHKPALQVYLFIVLAHIAEHVAQAAQIYVLKWPVPDSKGALGYFFPWLIKSELLHYGYALLMLACFWALRKGFEGRSYTWWMIAFWIQFWHHIEHGLLQAQAIMGTTFFGSPVPTSIIQLVIPRVELHLIYNAIVFIPMVIAMYYHMFPPEGEKPSHRCDCASRQESPGAVSA
jgi:hypothetical protein